MDYDYSRGRLLENENGELVYTPWTEEELTAMQDGARKSPEQMRADVDYIAAMAGVEL